MTTSNEQLPPADEGRRSSEGLGISPMEQLIGFVEWERKHNPGHKHVAEWALAEIERLQSHVELLETWKREGDRIFMNGGGTLFALGQWWADRPWRKRDA